LINFNPGVTIAVTSMTFDYQYCANIDVINVTFLHQLAANYDKIDDL